MKKQYKYNDLLDEWSAFNHYKTETARSALRRFANWLDVKEVDRKAVKTKPVPKYLGQWNKPEDLLVKKPCPTKKKK